MYLILQVRFLSFVFWKFNYIIPTVGFFFYCNMYNFPTIFNVLLYLDKYFNITRECHRRHPSFYNSNIFRDMGRGIETLRWSFLCIQTETILNHF